MKRRATRARVAQRDRTRRDYLRTCYGVDWDDPQLCDLVLNTEQMTIEGSANLVCQALARRDERNDEGAPEKGEPGLG